VSVKEIGLRVKSLVVQDNRASLLVESHGRLDSPGGRVEKVERLEEGLRREILDETGLAVEILSPVANWKFMKNDHLLVKGLTFYCRYRVALSS
jgi:ADP-ribose pyrophosphatase YjhB (NUDIX family)